MQSNSQRCVETSADFSPQRKVPNDPEWVLYWWCTRNNRLAEVVNSTVTTDIITRWVQLTYEIEQNIQHLAYTKFAFGLLYWSFNRSCSLSAIDKRNKKESSTDEEPPIKDFLEWKSLALEANWAKVQLLHVLSNINTLELKSTKSCRWNGIT